MKGKTGGQEGDPLEMLIFNLTIHHLRGRVLSKFQESRAVAYTDDGYIKTKLNVVLQVLADLKSVFKVDSGLEINVSKTSILPKGTTTQVVFDMAQTIMEVTPSLTHISNDFLVDSFCPEGFIVIGVPIVTDAFVQSFVSKTCRDIIDDVEKLDTIQDDCVHFHLFTIFPIHGYVCGHGYQVIREKLD